MPNHPNRARNAYLLVFGDAQNDYSPLPHTGTLAGAERKARKHAEDLGTRYDIKRKHRLADGTETWERISDVGDYE